MHNMIMAIITEITIITIITVVRIEQVILTNLRTLTNPIMHTNPIMLTNHHSILTIPTNSHHRAAQQTLTTTNSAKHSRLHKSTSNM